MARPAATYRAARRAAGKAEHKKNGAGVGKNMPRVSISPTVFPLGYELPSRLNARNKKKLAADGGPYIKVGNVPGGLRRLLREDAELNALADTRMAEEAA